MNKKNTKKSSTDQYEIIEGADVTEKDIKQALVLDNQDGYLSKKAQFDIKKCLNWYNTNNQIYTMIKDKEINRVVGYINAAPVNDECYEEIKDGKYPDAEIDDDDIVAYEIPAKPKKYNLYFASIVVDLNKDRGTRVTTLYNAFLEKLINFTKANIIVSRIVADTVSKEGELMCKSIGMEEIKKTEHKSTIYETQLYPPQFKAKHEKQKKLYDVLMKKYKELEEIE